LTQKPLHTSPGHALPELDVVLELELAANPPPKPPLALELFATCPPVPELAVPLSSKSPRTSAHADDEEAANMRTRPATRARRIENSRG
jgi:hypothetical protein